MASMAFLSPGAELGWAFLSPARLSARLPKSRRGFGSNRWVHPAIPLLRGGPIGLVTEHGLAMTGGYVDECHLCYTAREQLVPRFPQCLAPKESYGLLAQACRWVELGHNGGA